MTFIHIFIIYMMIMLVPPGLHNDPRPLSFHRTSLPFHISRLGIRWDYIENIYDELIVRSSLLVIPIFKLDAPLVHPPFPYIAYHKFLHTVRNLKLTLNVNILISKFRFNINTNNISKTNKFLRKINIPSRYVMHAPSNGRLPSSTPRGQSQRAECFTQQLCRIC